MGRTEREWWWINATVLIPADCELQGKIALRPAQVSRLNSSTVVVAARSRKSVTVVSPARLFSNRPVNLRINCPTIRRSTRVPACSTPVFVPCPGTFVLVLVISHTCSEAWRDTRQDNSVASRQRKSSHEKCTPRRKSDNQAEPDEENAKKIAS